MTCDAQKRQNVGVFHNAARTCRVLRMLPVQPRMRTSLGNEKPSLRRRHSAAVERFTPDLSRAPWLVANVVGRLMAHLDDGLGREPRFAQLAEPTKPLKDQSQPVAEGTHTASGLLDAPRCKSRRAALNQGARWSIPYEQSARLRPPSSGPDGPSYGHACWNFAFTFKLLTIKGYLYTCRQLS